MSDELPDNPPGYATSIGGVVLTKEVEANGPELQAFKAWLEEGFTLQQYPDARAGWLAALAYIRSIIEPKEEA